MLTNERYKVILDLLRVHNTIKIQDVVNATHASESTIRRDLTELEESHELVRIHGGATLSDSRLNEFSIDDKSAKNIHHKKQIAKYAADLIQDRECIYLDAGTTTMQMIPFLCDKDLTIVTNGLNHLELLMKHGISAYLTGGRIKVKTGALIGAKALESLQTYRFDKCFIGANGFEILTGYTTPDPEEASIKRLAHSISTESFVLADGSKYNQVKFAQISQLDSATLLTSNLEDQVIKELQERINVKDVMK